MWPAVSSNILNFLWIKASTKTINVSCWRRGSPPVIQIFLQFNSDDISYIDEKFVIHKISQLVSL